MQQNGNNWSDQMVKPNNDSSTTVVEGVFDELIQRIVRGDYGSGSRLPPERELAKEMGTSRPSLRKALSKLAEWRLVAVKPNSGMEVLPQREWTLEVLPTYLRCIAPTEIPFLLHSMLRLRRCLLIEVVALCCGRIPPASDSDARKWAEIAWDRRADFSAWAHADFQAIKALVVTADIQPAIWLLNRLSATYQQIVTSFPEQLFVVPVVDNYLERELAMFDAIEAADTQKATTLLSSMLDEGDSQLLQAITQYQSGVASAEATP